MFHSNKMNDENRLIRIHFKNNRRESYFHKVEPIIIKATIQLEAILKSSEAGIFV